MQTINLMLVKFENSYLENLYTGVQIKGKPRYGDQLVTKYKKKILMLKNVTNTQELSKIKSMNFEPLKGEKTGLFSIRIDQGWRIEFKISEEVIKIVDLNNHYE